MGGPCVLVNSSATGHSRVRKYLERNKVKYTLVHDRKSMHAAMLHAIKRKEYEFIVCGGDGTLNMFVQAHMQLSPHIQSQVRLGVLPCGRVNDFALAMDVPSDIASAYDRIQLKSARSVDVIRVNDAYVLTGGGFGFPAEVVQDADAFFVDHAGRVLGRVFKDTMYQLFAIKRTLQGCKGVAKADIGHRLCNESIAITIQNQQFIGHKFILAPYADNTDGMFDITIIPQPRDMRERFKALRQVAAGKFPSGTSYMRVSELTLKTGEPTAFMADGEILLQDTKFKVRIYPQALTVYC